MGLAGETPTRESGGGSLPRRPATLVRGLELTDHDYSGTTADARALRLHMETAHRRLVGYASLSATTTVGHAEDDRETTYRLHLMDITSRRMVPHLLGVSERGCDHMACEMVMLNSLTAGYMVEMGWSNDHSVQHAVDLLRANGGDIVFE